MSQALKIILTLVIIAVAVAFVVIKYFDYLVNPWTRDGQVMANVVEVAPRVSGPIVKLGIVDNQEVSVGDFLFQIDPRTFESELEQAQANYDRTLENMVALQKEVEAAQAGVEQSLARIEQARSQVTAQESNLNEAELSLGRSAALLETNDVSQARYDSFKNEYDVAMASKKQADAELAAANSANAEANAKLAQAIANRGEPGKKNARLRAAAASLEDARLNLEFTTVRASVDGYITNLDLRLGTQVVANKPTVALIDKHSFWIDAYFRETVVRNIRPGQQAVITLMGHTDLPFNAVVNSLSRGISKDDGSAGRELLPQVSPTFQWIRLAQRIPVRIDLREIPDGVDLRIGQTASVLVHTDGSQDSTASAAPALFQ